MENDLIILVNVDDEGNIIDSQAGRYIIPSEEWDFLFYRDEKIAEEIHEFRVVLNGMRKDLIRKEE